MFAIIDDELEDPVMIRSQNIWQAIITTYKENAPINMIAHCKEIVKIDRVKSLQQVIDECRQMVPEFMNRPEMQKYLMLI
jgi:hypothetical protein